MPPPVRLRRGPTSSNQARTLARAWTGARRTKAAKTGAGLPIRWTAITGTPGSGKSQVGRLLARHWEVVEVAELADRLGCTDGRSGGLREVDMDRLARRMARLRAVRGAPVRLRTALLIGHLAHLLPVRDVVVLRCHPRELRRRLRHRGAVSGALRANLASEAIGVILFEAAKNRQRGRLWEVDTTGRSPSSVARLVDRLLRTRPASRFGHVDWLSDPRVTEQLLRDPA